MDIKDIRNIPVLVVVSHDEHSMHYEQPRESIVEDGWAESLSLSPAGEIIVTYGGDEIRVIDPLREQA